MERILNRTCVTKPPEQGAQGSERSRVGEHPEELGWRCLRARGRPTPLSVRLALCASSIWLFISILYCILL